MTTPPLATREKTPENTGQAGRAGSPDPDIERLCRILARIIQRQSKKV